MNPKPNMQTLWLRLLVAVLIVAVASALRALLFGSLGRSIPFLIYYPAVMLAALYGGLAAGFLATVLSGFLVYFWIQHGQMSSLESIAMIIFGLSCGLVTLVCEAARDAREKLQAEIEERNRSEREIAQLNQSLELRVTERTAQLATANQELRNSAAYARSLLEASLDPLVTISAEGKITDVNEGSIQATGVSRARLIGTDFSDYFTEPDRAREGYQQVFAQGFVTDYPLIIRHRDGRLTEVLYNASVYRDSGGQVLGVFAAARDVSKIRLAEAQTRQLNLQLTEANKELEAFAYSVSHDLRAPLRSIDGFSRILLDDYAPRLDEDGRDSIARIRAAAQRMAQLIDDMLMLSRVTRAEMVHERVDLSGLARSVVHEMQKLEPHRRVDCVVAEGIGADGDQHLLRIVLENLLGNAWKFTNRRDRARIEFGATTREGATDYYVRDNGAGFDPAYAGKLFGAFQRLHSSTDFPGTGIGLATVQRIVRRHGGRVWAEGKVDAGATFNFNLGAATPSHPPTP